MALPAITLPDQLPDVPESQDGEVGLPALLAESDTIVQVSALGGQPWLLRFAEGIEQVQLVWVTFDAYGSDFIVDRVLIARPARGDLIDAKVTGAGQEHELADIGVSFVEISPEALGDLLGPHEAPAAPPAGVFSPNTGGLLIPGASALCRAAPRPPLTALAVVQFTDLGPAYAIAGSLAGADGFWSVPDTEGYQSSADDRGPPAGTAAKAKAKGKAKGKAAAKGKATAAPATPAPPRSLVDEIRGAVREEVAALSRRVSALEAQPAPTTTAGDLLFGPASARPQSSTSAATEARRLLGLGASSGTPPGRPSALRPGVTVPIRPPGLAAPRVSFGAAPGLAPQAPPAAGSSPPARDPLERLVELLERRAALAETTPIGTGAATSLAEYSNLLGGAAGFDSATSPGQSSKTGGLWALERIKATRRQRPELVVAAGESMVREHLGVLGDEAWSWKRHAETELMPAAGSFATLKRMIAMVAMALDEGRQYGPEAQTAALVHVYKVLDATARDPAHELQWPWPLLGITDPAGRRRPGWAPGEAAALVAYHRDEAALEDSKRKLAAAAAGAPSSSSQNPAGSPTDPAQVPGWLKAKIIAEAKGKGKGKGKDDKAPGAAGP